MLIRGTIRGTRQGFAFLAPDDAGEEIYIARGNLAGAVHGDRVEASLFRRSPYDFRPEAAIERILERPDPLYTGNVVKLARTLFVVPDIPVLPPRIRLKSGPGIAPIGSKVLFRIEGREAGQPPVARLEGVLGEPDDPALDALVVGVAYQLPTRFPDEAIDEALAAAERDDPEERARRRSYTDRLVLTIDPETAKDFDDAISIRKDSDGYHLDVHIADVTWFVAEGGALDLEAARRGNSVYFPGGVIPMLPEVLSSRSASLVPGEDRRVMTVEIDLSLDGVPRSASFHEGLIRSGARLSYEQAQAILNGEGDGGGESGGNGGGGGREVAASLQTMAELARLLRAARFRVGGFDLEIPETEVRVDARGMPVELSRHKSLESHRLIEEFMILANRMVGRFVSERGMPLLFRVHGEPDAAALERFAEVVLTLLPSTSAAEVSTMPALRRFLSGLPAAPLTRILHSFFLRSMKQAVYSAVDLGHFGLGIDRYCHFTSPIRRYPDLFDHRVVRWLIQHPEEDGAGGGERTRRWEEAAIEHAIHSSKTERTAEKAEREIVRLKVLRWAEQRVGEVYDGRVTGLTPSGLFVEFEEVPVEGFIPRTTLPPSAVYVEERFAFVDKRSKWELRLGDRVTVQIVRVDLRERFLDLELVTRGGKRRDVRPLEPETKRGRGKGRGKGRGTGPGLRGKGKKGGRPSRQPQAREGGDGAYRSGGRSSASRSKRGSGSAPKSSAHRPPVKRGTRRADPNSVQARPKKDRPGRKKGRGGGR